MQSYRARKSTTLSKPEIRVYFDTKYGPLSVHQNGNFAKELYVTCSTEGETAVDPPVDVYAIKNLRFSLHLERFEALVPFTEEIECIVSFPASERTVKHPLLCQMKIGQTHGAAAFQTSYLDVDMNTTRDSVVEIEFLQAEKSLLKMSLPLRLPSDRFDPNANFSEIHVSETWSTSPKKQSTHS